MVRASRDLRHSLYWRSRRLLPTGRHRGHLSGHVSPPRCSGRREQIGRSRQGGPSDYPTSDPTDPNEVQGAVAIRCWTSFPCRRRSARDGGLVLRLETVREYVSLSPRLKFTETRHWLSWGTGSLPADTWVSRHGQALRCACRAFVPMTSRASPPRLRLPVVQLALT